MVWPITARNSGCNVRDVARAKSTRARVNGGCGKIRTPECAGISPMQLRIRNRSGCGAAGRASTYCSFAYSALAFLKMGTVGMGIALFCLALCLISIRPICALAYVQRILPVPVIYVCSTAFLQPFLDRLGPSLFPLARLPLLRQQ